MSHVRPPTEEELVFVASSWLRSYVDSKWYRMFGDRDAYYSGQKLLIRRLLQRSQVVADIRDGMVAGWVCHEGDLLHYVYVRHLYRGLGVARGLLAQVPITTFTHLARSVQEKRIPKGWKFDPYALCR